MASEVEIVSSALRRLGDDAVLTLTEDSERARLVNALYPSVRDAVLRAHPWNAVLVRASIAKDEAKPSWGFDNAYTLPADPYCLRVLTTDADADGFAWKVEGRKILTDATSPLKILYIARVTDVNQYDSLLVECITARLAAEIAYAITGSHALSQTLWQLYSAKLTEARAMDGLEGTPNKLESFDLIDVRRT